MEVPEVRQWLRPGNFDGQNVAATILQVAQETNKWGNPNVLIELQLADDSVWYTLRSKEQNMFRKRFGKNDEQWIGRKVTFHIETIVNAKGEDRMAVIFT